MVRDGGGERNDGDNLGLGSWGLGVLGSWPLGGVGGVVVRWCGGVVVWWCGGSWVVSLGGWRLEIEDWRSGMAVGRREVS